MEIFKLFGSVLVNTDEAEKSIGKVDTRAQSFASKLGSGIATAAKWSAGLIGAAAAASAGVVGAIGKMDEATEEYRQNMGKLNTAWEAAGADADLAKEAYSGLYRAIGDSDTATEAGQLLAKLATNTQDVEKWTRIATGVVGTFGDALPVESLIEASNETAKVGEVTGALADALNWAGISEDEFNEKLAACGSEQERNQLITETLSETYEDAAAAYEKNNEQLLANRDSQLRLNETMAEAGATVDNLKSQFSSLGSELLIQLMPTIQSILDIIQENMPLVQQIFEQFAPVIVGMVETLLPHLLSLVETVLPVMAELLDLLVPVFVEIIESILPVVVSLIETLLPPLLDIVQAVLPLLLDLLRPLLDLLQPIIDLLAPLLELVVAFLEPLTQLLDDVLTPLMEKATEIAEDIIGTVTDKLSDLADAVADFVPDMIQKGKDLFNGLWDGIKAIWDSIKSWVDEKINWLIDKVTFWKTESAQMADPTDRGGGFGDGGGGFGGSHASGLPFVPYDGYRAILHRGETVLNARDTESLVEGIVNGVAVAVGSGSSAGTSPIVVPVYLDKQQIAVAMYDPLNALVKQRGVAFG